jgi:hypothetical protein
MIKNEIEGLTRQDWQPLFDLIPEIESTTKFSESFGMYSAPAPIVDQFLEIVYSIPIIVDFDWPSWDEGREMGRDPGFDFDSVDLLSKCKLITAVVRNDRFCEGALASAFESGLILKVLKSIQKTVDEGIP